MNTLLDTSAGPLADLVERGLAAEIPSSDWLVRLHLERPRRNVHCLSWRLRVLKRSVDIVAASVLLVLLAPVMAVVAILVRATSPGPVLYRQVRVGLNLRGGGRERRSRRGGDLPEEGERRSGGDRRGGPSFGRPFVLAKFRSMRTDAEAGGPRFASVGDARVTTLGRFLRRSRLDELPQLWNVLKGEMSLVGPRPERPEFIRGLSREVPGYLDRLGLKPGLTGLAQVLNGYDNETEGFRRKVALDLLYLQNCCLRNDLKILLRTVVVVLTGRGAI